MFAIYKYFICAPLAQFCCRVVWLTHIFLVKLSFLDHLSIYVPQA